MYSIFFVPSLLLTLFAYSCDGNDETPVTWSSASLNMEKKIKKCHWRSCWKSVDQWNKRSKV